MSQYQVNNVDIGSMLLWIKDGDVAIPEIQRPFVWKRKDVRDLIDSLYKGYPIGYIISWKGAGIKLKSGIFSEGKKILIDGQQRMTALQAALIGNEVVNKEYQSERIKIAFHVIEQKFEVLTPPIEKDPLWINDISKFFESRTNSNKLQNKYLKDNSDYLKDDSDVDAVVNNLGALCDMTKQLVGVIELNSGLDIDTVTNIFIRINSKGMVLDQADFVMSKIAANENFGGNNLRKAIDYFCHLFQNPKFLAQIEKSNDSFRESDFFKSMQWVSKYNATLYKPGYADVLRVAYTFKFNRGKFSDLVSLLSGRNFQERTNEERIEQESFEKLSLGVKECIKQTNFERFVMIIKSSGFIQEKMIKSKGALNFAYILYLKLIQSSSNKTKIESWVRKWFVMSMITNRYSTSTESIFDKDIRDIEETKSFSDFFNDTEKMELSDEFWELKLVDNLKTTATNASFQCYLASQVQANDRGFLSSKITVDQMLNLRGDMHHVFPKVFLKKNGLDRKEYNQVANLVVTQQEINLAIKDSPPDKYMHKVFEQCNTKKLKYGGIDSLPDLKKNFTLHCLPIDVEMYELSNYQSFLENRRKAMAMKIRKYYEEL